MSAKNEKVKLTYEDKFARHFYYPRTVEQCPQRQKAGNSKDAENKQKNV